MYAEVQQICAGLRRMPPGKLLKILSVSHEDFGGFPVTQGNI